MKCHICVGEKYKWMYYKDYNSLNEHFKASHHICTNPSCIEKCFVAFRTTDELDKHMTEVHKHPKKKIVLLNDTWTQEKFEIKDKEGYNFEEKVF